MALARIYWTLDGKAVDVEDDFAFNVVANGGFDQFRGSVPERQARKVAALGQGSVISGWVDNGTCVYEGRLAAPPHYVGGRARLAGSGYKVEAEKYATRRLFQSRDYRAWVAAASEPHLYAESEKYDADIFGGRLAWKVTGGEAIAINGRAGFVFWAAGQTLRRITATINKSGNNADEEIRLYATDGPATALGAADVTYGLGPAGPPTFDRTLGTTGDLVAVYVAAGAANTPATNERYWLTDLRVNGLTLLDTFYGYEVVDNTADLLGWDDAGISTTALNVLPLDWRGPLSGLLDYIAMLEDRRWLVLDDRDSGPYCDYQGWDSREWVGYQGKGIDASGLVPQELFNKVVVSYETVGGIPQEVSATATVASLDAKGITNTHYEELRDAQAGSSLASSVATNVVTRLSVQRYAGPIDVKQAFLDGRHAPREILPGETFTVADWAQGENISLRIHEVQQRKDSVVIGSDREVSAARRIAKAALQNARR